MDQREKAQAFRRMHVEPPILVLPNAWDVASAKLLAALDGCRALATSSAAVARSLGFEDGERAPGAVMVEAAGRIAQAVDVPVTGDLERGYGDPVGTARAAWDAGLVGINFEDSTRAGLVDVEEQAAAIRAIREAVPDLVINARVDIFVRIGTRRRRRGSRARQRLPRSRRGLHLSDPRARQFDRRARPSDQGPDQRDRRAEAHRRRPSWTSSASRA